MEFKVMQYNILHGFHSGGQGEKKIIIPFKFQPERLISAQIVVKKENPEVLVLNESCFVEKEEYGTKMDYPKLFNYPYSFYASNNNYEWGNTILSKYPIVSGENYRKQNRTFFKVKIDFNGKIINFYVAHPHPSLNEEEKRDFFKES